MRCAWSTVNTSFMEPNDEKVVDRFDEKRVVHCDDKGNGVLF